MSQIHSLGHGPGCCCQGLGHQRKEVHAAMTDCSRIVKHTLGVASRHWVAIWKCSGRSFESVPDQCPKLLFT